jgi:hypothetical protein
MDGRAVSLIRHWHASGKRHNFNLQIPTLSVEQPEHFCFQTSVIWQHLRHLQPPNSTMSGGCYPGEGTLSNFEGTAGIK